MGLIVSEERRGLEEMEADRRTLIGVRRAFSKLKDLHEGFLDRFDREMARLDRLIHDYKRKESSDALSNREDCRDDMRTADNGPSEGRLHGRGEATPTNVLNFRSRISNRLRGSGNPKG